MSQKYSTNEKLKNKNPSSPLNPNDEQRYCICQKREDELNDDDNNDFMIECDGCNGWFHGKCVDLADRIADDIEKYFCNECSKQYGPSIFKQRRNQHRRDYSDANADNKPTQSGTPDFINKLKRKIFPNCDSVITRLKGNQLTTEYVVKNGFTKPILVTNRDGLDMSLPNRAITLAEINDFVGHDRFIDIIDCEKQVTYKMGLDDYIEYFESFERNKIYNVLSLEISNTKLGEQVVTPQIVRDLSWATIGVWPIKKQEKQNDEELNSNENQKKTIWPLQTITSLSKKKRRTVSSTDTDQSDDEQYDGIEANHFENFERPEVAKYCLMSPQSSYTDFHIDFGGSSVWYSVVRGEKVFYLIEPTDENLQKYADWSGSPNESEVFLGDCVTHCYKMHLREENTVLIPPGWIHAVYTVTDSLVFGGNFLQSLGVDMQLRIYELERLAQVPNKFQFPLFETFHWYAAKTFYEELKQCNETNALIINPITQQASESIIHYMSKWLSVDKRYQLRNRTTIPKGINCEKILRDLARELDLAKTRCGSSCISKPPSNSIIASPIKVVLPIETKQELTHVNNTKIKVKCRRLSSENENIKNKESSGGASVKLTIKTTLSGCRKPSSNRELTSNINKKKTGRTISSVKQQKNSNMNDISVKQEESPKITYTLDLEAKRQRFIEPANIQSNHDEPDKDINTSSNRTNVSLIPRESHTDINDIHDNNESLGGIADGGLASFVKSSSINDDYYHPSKESKMKREHSGSDKKISIKKSKSKTSTELNKLTKKIKNEDSTSSNSKRKKLLTTTTTTTTIPKPSSSTNNNPPGIAANKKRLSSSTPKKLNSKDRLGKILKIANSIKSRGGILT
ncbi:unnamed protein product [Rotaria sordida]|uniref:Uncharacterized protein n=1 Tax=Rotaria sordida TaxID=392033 RepID=A0A815FCS7_9BILA|nr:unnamed protein product [Rotaria sordida]CAF1326835.1 unnamed protein product [Rotaria sordida]